MRSVRLFLHSAGIILCITALAKFIESSGHEAILQVRDPLIGIRFQWLLCIVALLEIAVALVCFLGKRPALSSGITAWLATVFGAYRSGLAMVGWRKPCGCMGNLTDALHISSQTANTATIMLLSYLLIGSYATLFWLQWQKRSFVGVNG